MIKLISNLCIAFVFIFSSVSHATLIISDDSYISFNLGGVDYDVAWASRVNTERYYSLSPFGTNLLLDPELYDGWGFATPEQLVLLRASSVKLSEDLTRLDGSYIHAFDYWNDFYSAPDNTVDIEAGRIGSQWVWSINTDGGTYAEDSVEQFSEISNRTGSSYDTFYIRASQVPEPSTLMIFALGLIALASKKRLFS
jgi:hypothetical protein